MNEWLTEAGASRVIAAAMVLVAWIALCIATVARERRHARTVQRERELLQAHAAGGRKPVLIAYASQTGTAESLAWHSARALDALGAPVQLMPMSELTMPRLQDSGVALFVTSTYGEGDPPDNASSFVGRLLDGVHRLDHLSYAVLALGDRQYANFCAFGHQLAGWLRERGGQALTDTIEVDSQDSAALGRWQTVLRSLVSAPDDSVPTDLMPALPTLTYDRWRTVARERLNPGDDAHPLYRLVLRPAAGGTLSGWQAGDLAVIRHPADPEHPREYSIASLPDDDGLELIVRQERHEDGSLGLVSGALTAGALGDPTSADSIELALRPNRNFRLDGNEQRPLILIGNGSGIAGLLAMIREARKRGSRGHWLIFGERDPDHDRPVEALTDRWLADGTLTRVDRVFSRAPEGREYVQHRLAAEAARLREALDAGAAIYVCGSAVGMAGGVQQVLYDLLGRDRVNALRDAGRYRRDVY